ncbi:MAG: hypothetical protein IJJ84_06455, partial [Kiritimatiellae bacterium]|nr:hypothetical protein [Kiritimatiellia bacterium]
MKKTLLLTCAVAALQAAATSETIANRDVNSVLVVESGDSLQVTNNMSIATTAGATGIVTNRGAMTVKDLD